MRLRLLTVAWGAAFIDRFLQLTLRTLLAPGNLPAVTARHDVAYSFYTTDADAERLTAHPLFGRLGELLDLQLQRFAITSIDPSDPGSHWLVWRQGIDAAQREDAALITIAPDHVFGGDTLQRWADLFEAGKLAVFSPGIQAAAETLEAALARDFPGLTPIDLKPAHFLELMFRHLHPVNITMFRDSPRFMNHPEYHLRAAPGIGFTQNILASHAVGFRPGKIAMTADFRAEDHVDRIAFEPSGFLSAEPLLKILRLYYRRWQLDPDALSHFGHWADHFLAPANIHESRITHAYAAGGRFPDAQRRAYAHASRTFVDQLMASRRVHRLWHGLRRFKLSEAARWLAVAHMHARLRRRLALPEAATLYVPRDLALSVLHPSEAARLLARGGSALIAAMRAHAAPGQRTHRRGDRIPMAEAAGASGTARILRGPLKIDETSIYVIDRPLVGVELDPRASSGPAVIAYHARAAVAESKQAILPVILRHPRLHALVRHVRGHRDHAGTEPLADLGPAGQQAMACYRKALAWRSHRVVLEVCTFYQERVLAGSGIASAPAERLTTIATPAADAPLRWLSEAVAAAPTFGEAWLELGYLHLERGDRASAMTAFAQAAPLEPALQRTPSDPSHRLVADYERALLLQQDGHPDQALALLERMPNIAPIPWRTHLLRARLLLGCGRPDAALPWFERALQRDLAAPHYGGALPRDLAELERMLDTAAADAATPA